MWWDFSFRPGHHPTSRHYGPAAVRYPFARTLKSRLRHVLEHEVHHHAKDKAATTMSATSARNITFKKSARMSENQSIIGHNVRLTKKALHGT